MRTTKQTFDSKTQILTSKNGDKLAVLPLELFNHLVEMAEELDDIRLYDEAKKSKSKGVEFGEYLKKRKKKKHA